MPHTPFSKWVIKHNKSVGITWRTPPLLKQLPKKKRKTTRNWKLNWVNVNCDGMPVLKKTQ